MKTTPLQNAIIVASIIGSIMAHYDPRLAADRKKPIDTIRKRVKKFLFRRSRISAKEFIECCAIADEAWQETVNHFVEKKISIDAVSTVIRLYWLYADALSKYANINDKQMEAYAYGGNINQEIEHASYEVSDYILDKLAHTTGIHRKKLNLLQKAEDV
jgi:hypothetical protein